MPPMTPRAIFFVHLRGGVRKSLLFFAREGVGWVHGLSERSCLGEYFLTGVTKFLFFAVSPPSPPTLK